MRGSPAASATWGGRPWLRLRLLLSQPGGEDLSVRFAELTVSEGLFSVVHERASSRLVAAAACGFWLA